MKRILTLVLVVFAALIPTSHAFADSVTFSPDTYTSKNDSVNISCPLDVGGGYVFNATSDKPLNNGSTLYCTNGAFWGKMPTPQSAQLIADNEPNWSWDSHDSVTFVVFNSNIPNPDIDLSACYSFSSTVEGCQTALQDAGVYEDTVTVNYAPPPFEAMVGQGDTAFETVTGTNLAAGVAWTGDNFIKPWLGSGLALLGGLAGWLAALAAIAAVIFLFFRAANKIYGIGYELGAKSRYKNIGGGSTTKRDFETETRLGTTASKKAWNKYKKKKKIEAKPLAQKGGGFQAYKLRQALKKGKYKDSKVHSAFGKNWT